MEESKYLGGDASHTHLVKGLDFALLSKVRNEVELGPLAQSVYTSVAQLLHPSHKMFGARVREMGKRLVAGVKMRTTQQFTPGRMTFMFDLELQNTQDTPLVTFR